MSANTIKGDAINLDAAYKNNASNSLTSAYPDLPKTDSVVSVDSTVITVDSTVTTCDEV